MWYNKAIPLQNINTVKNAVLLRGLYLHMHNCCYRQANVFIYLFNDFIPEKIELKVMEKEQKIVIFHGFVLKYLFD